jgi:hypothetical protein
MGKNRKITNLDFFKVVLALIIWLFIVVIFGFVMKVKTPLFLSIRNFIFIIITLIVGYMYLKIIILAVLETFFRKKKKN